MKKRIFSNSWLGWRNRQTPQPTQLSLITLIPGVPALPTPHQSRPVLHHGRRTSWRELALLLLRFHSFLTHLGQILGAATHSSVDLAHHPSLALVCSRISPTPSRAIGPLPRSNLFQVRIASLLYHKALYVLLLRICTFVFLLALTAHTSSLHTKTRAPSITDIPCLVSPSSLNH